MYLIHKYFTAFLLIFLIYSTAEAQTNPVYKIMIQRGWVPYEGNDKNELIEHAKKDVVISLGYNDTTVSNLQKIGVDLLKLNQKRPWDEKYLTAISDCIIIGTVAKKEYPLEEKAWFHTIAYVQVGEFLRNDYNLPIGQIPIMIESGPTASGESSVSEGEDTLQINEYVLLFLNANGLIQLAKNNNQKNLYNQLINDPVIRFRMVAKYDIVPGYFRNRIQSEDIVEFRNNISSVLNVIHR